MLSALTLNEDSVIFLEKIGDDEISIGSESINNKTIIIKFTKPISANDKKLYYDNGIKSIVYAGNLSYYFYADKNIINDINKTENILGFSEFKIAHKASKNILDHNTSEYSKDEEGNYILNILLLSIYDKDVLKSIFDDINVEILTIYHDLKKIEIKLPSNQLETLLQLPIIKHIEEKTPPLTFLSNYKKTRNINSANLINTSSLWSAPYNLSGDGIKAAVVDGGQIRTTHQEFQKNGAGRVTIMGNNNNLSSHATHVGGTIGAFGIEPLAKGMANDTFLYSYYYNNYAFAVAMEQAYNDEEILLSNHSYGYMFKVYLGEYNSGAQAMDNSVYNNPYLNAFMAAGNDRDNAGYDRYGIIKGPPNAKNIFTIGAVIDDGETLADFSSTGPVKDGRIKPDLVANGTSLYSTDSSADDAYISKNGTSMAAPSAAGAAALMMQQYKLETISDIKHHVLKSIMINSAVDKGRYRPDYEFGFGLIDAKAAVDVIKTINTDNPLIKEGTISHGQNASYCFFNSQERDFKVTISWVDPPGNPANQNKTLVNDIDIWLKDSNGNKYYPFSLDKDNPEDVATANSLNKIDNIEQIFIPNLPIGEYRLFVNGYEIITSSQEFAIVSNIPFNSIPAAPSNLNITVINSSTVKLSWSDNSHNESGFKIYRNGSLIHTTAANVTDYTDTGLSHNTIYNYELQAANCAGDSNTISSSVKIGDPNFSIPFPPDNFKATKITGTSITLVWDDLSDDESGFEIRRDSNLIYTTKPNATTYTDHGLTPNTEYTYYIAAINKYGKSPYRSLIAATKNEYLPPLAPTSLIVSQSGKNNAYLTWHDNSTTEDGFEIFRNGTLLFTTDSNTVEFIDTGLIIGEKYLYEIRAVNKYGASSLIASEITIEKIIDIEKTYAFIKRLYNNILHRETDQEGLEYWTNNIIEKNSALFIAKSFYESEELKEQNLTNQEFIINTYNTLLDREADEDGLKYWIEQLETKGISRNLIFYGFAFSNEFKNLSESYGINSHNSYDRLKAFMERIYLIVLEREIDGGGLEYWVNTIQSREKTIYETAKYFFFSPEFSAKNHNNEKFITIAYKTLLNREADEQGLQYWIDKLNNSMTRENIINNFLYSKEFSNLIITYGL